jgi:carbon-monoxide dehydrogenase medium subunit
VRAAEPLTVTEAVSALAAEGARCVAGGQSLVAMMNAGLVSPDVLVSLRRVQGLDGVAWTSDGELVVGAMTRHRDVARIVPRGAASALLVAAAQRIGHPAIRNQGTIGGSIAHADPAADMPTAIVCADDPAPAACLRGVSSKATTRPPAARVNSSPRSASLPPPPARSPTMRS